jgi:hypothetical protein
MDDHVGFGGQRVDGFPIQDAALLVRRLRPAVRRSNHGIARSSIAVTHATYDRSDM